MQLLWQEGVAQHCWEKHPDKKRKPKPKAQSPFSKGKHGKTRMHLEGVVEVEEAEKVDREEEYDEQEDHYDELMNLTVMNETILNLKT